MSSAWKHKSKILHVKTVQKKNVRNESELGACQCTICFWPSISTGGRHEGMKLPQQRRRCTSCEAVVWILCTARGFVVPHIRWISRHSLDTFYMTPRWRQYSLLKENEFRMSTSSANLVRWTLRVLWLHAYLGNRPALAVHSRLELLYIVIWRPWWKVNDYLE